MKYGKQVVTFALCLSLLAGVGGMQASAVKVADAETISVSIKDKSSPVSLKDGKYIVNKAGYYTVGSFYACATDDNSYTQNWLSLEEGEDLALTNMSNDELKTVADACTFRKLNVGDVLCVQSTVQNRIRDILTKNQIYGSLNYMYRSDAKGEPQMYMITEDEIINSEPTKVEDGITATVVEKTAKTIKYHFKINRDDISSAQINFGGLDPILIGTDDLADGEFDYTFDSNNKYTVRVDYIEDAYSELELNITGLNPSEGYLDGEKNQYPTATYKLSTNQKNLAKTTPVYVVITADRGCAMGAEGFVTQTGKVCKFRVTENGVYKFIITDPKTENSSYITVKVDCFAENRAHTTNSNPDDSTGAGGSSGTDNTDGEGDSGDGSQPSNSLSELPQTGGVSSIVTLLTALGAGTILTGLTIKGIRRRRRNKQEDESKGDAE